MEGGSIFIINLLDIIVEAVGNVYNLDLSLLDLFFPSNEVKNLAPELTGEGSDHLAEYSDRDILESMDIKVSSILEHVDVEAYEKELRINIFLGFAVGSLAYLMIVFIRNYGD